ncbi:MAG: fibrobacter succinogenes major paralogous domain-containing protein [Fibrobacter sp.]|nr:fibrobacter succinogenes major paralogous domain-containing protein [Fibrobacter sp.]
MKKFLLSTAFIATFAVFVACGDDVTEVTEVNEIHQEGMAVLDAGLELSKQKCDTSNVGEMLFVADSSEVFVCDGKTWQTLKGADGKPGENGDNGNDGTSCTASVNKDGDFDLVCGGKSVGTIKNGANGKDGLPGADGDDGDDGESCTAKPVKNDAGLEGLEVTCGETVVGTIWSGKPGEDGMDGNDGASCTAKSVENDAGLEGLEVTCGKTVVGTIWNGEDGDDGNDGENGVGCSVNDEGDGTVTVTCGEGDDATTTTLYKAVCGIKPYDPAKAFCLEGKVYDLCGGKTYDLEIQYCKMGETVENYGRLEDTRDDQVYKVVTIGTQTWMAQNLNYAPDENHVRSLGYYAWSGCYGGKADLCSKYGRLYTWEVAMDKAGCGYGGSCNNSYEGTQGICPEGWHLPTYAEWNTLFTNVGGKNVAGRMLKSEEGWKYYSESTKGIDYYGISALPAGIRYRDGSFGYAGSDAYFWSSSESGSNNAYSMYLYNYHEDAYLDGSTKLYAFSVRCLLNN